MKFPHLKNSSKYAYSVVSSLVMILATLLCGQHESQAQQPLASQPDTSMDPLKYINWVEGPQKVTLGDVADINISAGYRLTDVHGARMILDSLGSPIPDDLVGILVPASGKWMATLEYSPSGYVKKPDMKQINTKPVLNEILNQIANQGQGSVTSLSWQSPPAYDSGRHLLEWSLKVVTPTSKISNQTAVMMGRRGVLQVTVAQHFPPTAAPSMKQLVSNISFKSGERYTDYQNGDKIAEIGLAELISGEKPPQPAGFFSPGFGTITAWIYSGLGACLLTGAVVVVRRRHRTRRRRAHHRRTHAPVPALAIKSKIPVNNISSRPAPVAIKNGDSNGHGQPIPASNHSGLSKPFHRNRRRRAFDYPKFFTKVMGEMSSHYHVPVSMAKGKSWSRNHANGHGNPDSNGNSASNDMNLNQTITSEIGDLIAAQKSLIQEQKSLLELQTRLIDEKRKLIAEQTAMLKAKSGPTPDQQQFWPPHQEAA